MSKQALKYYIFGIVLDSFFDRLIKEFTVTKKFMVHIERIGYSLHCLIVYNSIKYSGRVGFDVLTNGRGSDENLLYDAPGDILDELYSSEGKPITHLFCTEEAYKEKGAYTVIVSNMLEILENMCRTDAILNDVLNPGLDE